MLGSLHDLTKFPNHNLNMPLANKSPWQAAGVAFVLCEYSRISDPISHSSMHNTQTRMLQLCNLQNGMPPRMLARHMPAAQSILSAAPAGHALTCNVPVELVSDEPPPVPASTSSSFAYA